VEEGDAAEPRTGRTPRVGGLGNACGSAQQPFDLGQEDLRERRDGRGSALEIAAEFALDVSRHGPLGNFPPGEPVLEVLRYDLVERRLLGPTPLVAAGRRGAAMRSASDSRGKPCDRGDHERTGKWTA